MRLYPIVGLFLLVLLAGLFLARHEARPPERSVAEQWAETIHNYSLIPVYPIREDVYVGDVYLSIDFEDAEKGSLNSRRLLSLDMSETMQNYYKKRPSLPSTLFDETSGVLMARKQPRSEHSVFLGDGKDLDSVNRLRLAALPGIKVATVSGGTSGARAPFAWFDLAFGGSAEASRTFDIALTGIEEIQVPSDYTIKLALEKACNDSETEKFLSSDAIRFALAQLVAPDPDKALPTWESHEAQQRLEKARPQVRVVSRVLYARAIDYTFAAGAGSAAELAAVARSREELGELVEKLRESKEATSRDGTNEAEPAAPGSASAVRDRASGLAGKASGLLSSVAGSTAPGNVGSFLFVDSRGLTLREVFERPMAFAVQAVAFSVRRPEDSAGLCGAISVAESSGGGTKARTEEPVGPSRADPGDSSNITPGDPAPANKETLGRPGADPEIRPGDTKGTEPVVPTPKRPSPYIPWPSNPRPMMKLPSPPATE